MARRCYRCREEKPEGEFYWKNKQRTVRSACCKPCQKKLSAGNYARHRTRYVADARKRNLAQVERLRAVMQAEKDCPCADCGGKYPYWVMQFDHVRGSKVREVSNLVTRAVSVRALRAEIAKCEVVCANCHANRTHLRRLGILASELDRRGSR